ncbi:MAG: acyl carrier protein [Paludibacter sp.]|nr:acyl carrier protein [Paludibacter sp.]
MGVIRGDSIFKSVFENPNIEITPATSAKEIHQWNSMNHILLISAIENHFRVSFELDELIAINNVADIILALQSKTTSKTT